MKAVLRGFGRLVAAVLIVSGMSLAGGAVSVATSSVAMAQSMPPITVRGNTRIEADTIRAYFKPAPGEHFGPAKIDDAIKNLYATGMFSDVKVSRAGGGYVVTVSENQVINQVSFEGNSKIKDKVLEAEVQSKSRGPFNKETVQGDVRRILELYRRTGRYDATVEPQIISRPNGRVDLIFNIHENESTKVSEIRFEGNKAFSDSRLRDEMTTTESNFLSFIKTSDIYDPDRINADLELVRKFYLSRGYADFRVVSTDAKLDESSHSFIITVTVDEGEKYNFGNIDVESSVPDVDAASLKSVVTTSQGETYNATAVEKSVEAMSVELAKRGYAFAQVRPRGSRDYSAHTIGVTYSVEEGSRVYIERINIRGNTRTRDYVIRREFDVAEGDAYNQALIDRAERRLNNLGFFKSVRITSEPGSAPDRVIVNVDVMDQPTGEFSVAGGYSTQDGLIAQVSVAEKNFLGRGQYIRLSTSLGQRTRGVEFNFTEPYFLGRRISAGFDAYAKKQDETNYSSYKVDTEGGAIRFGFPITEEFTIGTNYTLYNRKIDIPGDEYDDASAALKESEGNNLVSQAGYSLVWNTLDNTINPHDGWRAEFRQDFAGLGGDSKFLRTTADVRYYHELPADMVGFLRAQGGYTWGYDGDLRILDQFFMGPDLVRGFAPSGIGPRDANSDDDDPLGGTTYFGGTAEVQFPLWGIPREFGLKGAVFADAGTVFGYNGCEDDCKGGSVDVVADNHKIRSSVGASLLWNSPLGPLRFDYAYVLSSDKHDDEQAFRFSGGARF